ncbi:MFS transporter [Stackebrandtia endophytica]|uniref:MFS transporter n=1 Tax=Stackebrandtia endophytica TaxID=1496996 RepID=UPI0014774367|nr:MFS transporter [Stackebrandtia endophytica]
MVGAAHPRGAAGGAIGSRIRRPARFHAIVLIGFATAIAALTTLVGRVPLPVALTIAVIGGSGGPVVAGGLSSLVAASLPDTAHGRGYAWDAATYNAASVVGPAVVAAVATLFSASTSGYLLAAAATGAGVLIFGVSTRPVDHNDRTPAFGTDLVSGFVTVWRRPVLRAVTAASCLAYLGLGGLTITAVLAARQWGSATQGGLLMTCFAVGATAGALGLARRPVPIAPQWLAALSLLITGIGLAGAAAATSVIPAGAFFLLAGLGDGPLLGATFHVRATHTTPRDRAQVFTTGAALKISAAALGAAVAGSVPVSPMILLVGIAITQGAAALLLWLMLRHVGSVTKVAAD